MKTELLIPVGNKECLISAINNGADAVYLGGKKFGARAYSNNFNNEEMIEAINYCHLNNTKIYVTVNTMIYNNEIKDALDYLKFLYENNVDAVIMQDNGLIELTRKLIPNLEIHVSTQAHNYNIDQINHYKEIGCTRVVFDRESSLEEINNIDLNIEKEVFVYGALCVCYSGNCLFSAMNGGRSANRGMCVGSCRKLYKLEKDNQIVDEGYLLSTKDLNTTKRLKEILDSNITSLKVEGRMKSKEYVAVITRIYRRLIDAYYNNEPMNITKEDIENQLKTYNREFTEGYLFNEKNIMNKKTSNHQGIPIGEVIEVNNKKIKIKLTSDLSQGDAIRFEKTNTGMYVNTLYNTKDLLTSEIKKDNIAIIDNKERIMYKDLIGSKVLKTIDIKLNQELNSIKDKKNPLNMTFIGHLNNNSILRINYLDKEVEVEGNIVSEALKRPVTKENIKEQLTKLGNTPFYCNKINIDIDSNIFINLKELNELRREAIEKLYLELREKKNKIKPIEIPVLAKQSTTNPKISILVRNEKQLKIALRNNLDIIYTTNETLYNKYKDNKNIYLRINRLNNNKIDYQNEKLLCTELGQIIKYKSNNILRSDYPLNVANDYNLKKLLNLNVNSITLSVENDIDSLLNINNKEKEEIIIYGRSDNKKQYL